MNKVTIFAATLAYTLTACSSLTNTTTTSSAPTAQTTSTTAATTTGKTAGMALEALMQQYRNDGKLDLKNTANLLSIVSLAGTCTQLAANKADSNYKTAFLQGMMSATGLVTDTNKEQVSDRLTDMANNIDTTGLQSAIAAGQTASADVQNAAGSITSLLSMFK